MKYGNAVREINLTGCELSCIAPTCKGELRQVLNITVVCIRESVVSMQGEKFAQLAIYNPPYRTICVLAFYTKYGLLPVKRVETVAHADAETVEEDGYPSMPFLVALDP